MLNKFGGSWTRIKIDVLRSYLAFFTKALRKQGFQLWYIDAFAGTGRILIERRLAEQKVPAQLGMFDLTPDAVVTELAGSALMALNVKPPFSHYVFIEKHRKRFKALQRLCDDHPEAQALSFPGDANEVLREICTTTNWRGPKAPGNGIRAVMFLDPFGMAVDFSTLECIAATKAIDVWYLFPLSGLYRQASRSAAKITDRKRAAVSRILGTEEWFDRLYRNRVQPHFFDPNAATSRVADVDAIEAYVRERLSIPFHTVTTPMRLMSDRNAPLFSLFFAISNSDDAAVTLALRGATQIMEAGISSQVR